MRNHCSQWRLSWAMVSPSSAMRSIQALRLAAGGSVVLSNSAVSVQVVKSNWPEPFVPLARFSTGLGTWQLVSRAATALKTGVAIWLNGTAGPFGPGPRALFMAVTIVPGPARRIPVGMVGASSVRGDMGSWA